MSPDPYKIFLSRFGSFTDVQKAAFAVVEEGENCIITAPTGSGKTEAAVLPLFNRILKDENNMGIQVVYVTPLRALNRDLIKRLESLGKELGLKIAVRHGDTPIKERSLQAANPPQVLITTPETFQNLFLSQRLRNALANVKTVIVDELHELYANKRGAQLAIALERLAEISGDYQRIGISATIGNIDEARRFLFGNRSRKTVETRVEKKIKVDIELPQKPSRDYREFRKKFDLDQQTMARLERIADMIRNSKSTLIFANTRQVVESLGSKLLYFDKISPFGSIGVHHSSLDKEERVSTENSFKEGRIKSIIATSSLELGIDIGSVNLVLQYGSPRQVIRLVQRVGRGGHREKETSYGKVIVANHMDVLESLAIIDQMRKGLIEKQRMEECALDVLTNQVCGIVLEYGKISVDRIYSIIRRAAPYEKFGKEAFEKLLTFLTDQRLVRIRDGVLSVGSRCRDYFFSNISVIPDTVRFHIKNAISNRTISSLDEKFVSNYLEEGSVFITKGLPWKVISIEDDVVQVEPSVEFEAAIPDWEGEDIPVSYATARRLFEFIKNGISEFDDVLDRGLREQLAQFRESQKGYFLPEKDAVFVDELDDYAIVYTALGKLANEFLAKLIGQVASQIAGIRLMVKATPYAIIVDYGGARKRPSIKKVLETVKNYDVEGAVSSGGLIANTELFRYKFVQVCKLFGVIDKKAKITKRDSDRLIKFYKDSPIFEETIRDLKKNYLDVETTTKFLETLRRGDVVVKVLEGARSPIANEILKASYYYKELLLPALPDETTVREFESRLTGKRVELLCTFCGFDFFREMGLDKEEKITCPRCKSPMICSYGDEKASVLGKKIAGKVLNTKDNTIYNEAIREASLIESYGDKALAALSTYGIGLTTAARVLKLMRRSNKQFIMDLIGAQKTFIKTKKYWK